MPQYPHLLAVKLPEDLNAWLRKHAQEEERQVSDCVRRLLRERARQDLMKTEKD